MATVAIVGAGHVGVVYASGLAELGHVVRVVDIDRQKVARLRKGQVWFFEPSLPDLLGRGIRRRRLRFTTSYPEALDDAQFVFVCVPTPTTADGSLDDSILREALDSIRAHAGDPSPIIVNKSTVPVGTGDLAGLMFADAGLRVVSSPEFLAEDRAVDDFFHPHRIVLGSRDRAAADEVAKLFAPLRAPILHTDNTSAEFSKLAANAFLAVKVSFANALARLSEAVGADAESVTQVLSLDPRIGAGHLRAGLGFGGSCLPKDVAAVEHLVRKHAANADLFGAVLRVNRDQRSRVVDHLLDRFGSVADKRIAILGLAFKAGTDDTRDSAAVALAEQLLALHAKVVVYDPIVRFRPRSGSPRPAVARSSHAAARAADAVIFATEWPELANTDLVALRKVMRGDVLVDGRGIISPRAARSAGFDYFCFGRGRQIGNVRILVAGGGGFVGSHLVAGLLDARHSVVVLDSFATSSSRNLTHLRGRRLRVVKVDVREAPFGRYDRIYNLASPASPTDYDRLPIETLLTNAIGTWRLLVEIARRTGARFLLASTSEVYGDPIEHPQRESYHGDVDPIGPRSQYDEAKRFAEALTAAYVRRHGLDARIARIFNSYGPRMRPDDGRMPSSFISSAVRGEPILVHGTGRQTRSLCFVGDTVAGLVAVMERGQAGHVYNIGRPDEISVIDFARSVKRMARSPSPIRRTKGRPGDIQRRRPDISKARRELGWRPVTTLEAGLRETIAWFREELAH